MSRALSYSIPQTPSAGRERKERERKQAYAQAPFPVKRDRRSRLAPPSTLTGSTYGSEPCSPRVEFSAHHESAVFDLSLVMLTDDQHGSPLRARRSSPHTIASSEAFPAHRTYSLHPFPLLRNSYPHLVLHRLGGYYRVFPASCGQGLRFFHYYIPNI